jgi:tetratricopeptide (TPR) repeat protein
MKLASAASSWVNLGVLCSEQGRFEEALELYRKALSIREKTPNTPASRIASVLNNTAGVYRRMQRFDEAHAAIDRAIRLIKPDEPAMPSYYGTRGEILLDEGQAERSLEWIGKAISMREKQTSPDREALTKNYEKEIEALQKLGRNEEAEQSRIKLTELRSAIESTPKTETGSSASSGIIEGAVYVELPFGTSKMTPKLREQISDLVGALSAKIREGLYGRFSGTVTVPEHVTLIFYGSNAELLFAVIEPILTAEKVCAGTRVLIQQNGVVREQMVSTPCMSVN